MDLPAYLIARPLVETYMERRVGDAATGDRPEPPRHPRRAATALRSRLSAGIHALADALAPAPAMPACDAGSRG